MLKFIKATLFTIAFSSTVSASNIVPIIQLLLLDESPIKISTTETVIPFTSVVTTFRVESINLLSSVTISIGGIVVFQGVPNLNEMLSPHTAYAGQNYIVIARDISGAELRRVGKIGDTNPYPPRIKNTEITILENLTKRVFLGDYISDGDSDMITSSSHRITEIPNVISNDVTLFNHVLEISPLTQGNYAYRFTVEDEKAGFSTGQLNLNVLSLEQASLINPKGFGFCTSINVSRDYYSITNNCDVAINAGHMSILDIFSDQEPVYRLEDTAYISPGITKSLNRFSGFSGLSSEYEICLEPYETRVINNILKCTLEIE